MGRCRSTNIGRNYLLEHLRAEIASDQVRIVDTPNSRRAFEQLVRLETEMRESGTVYTCPSGQHDDLGISLAMLVWAARHPHLESWVRILCRAPAAQAPRKIQLGSRDLTTHLRNAILSGRGLHR